MGLTEIMTIKVDEQLGGKHLAFRSVEWCCDRMGTAWLRLEVTFGNELFMTISNYAGVRLNQVSGHPFGQVGSEIDHCPYCGAKIDVVVNKEAA